MSGPLLVNASQKRLRRLGVWVLPFTFGALIAAGTYPWGHA